MSFRKCRMGGAFIIALVLLSAVRAQEQTGGLENVETALSALLDAVAAGLPVEDACLNFIAVLVAYIWDAFVALPRLCLRAPLLCLRALRSCADVLSLERCRGICAAPLTLITPLLSMCGSFIISSGSYFVTIGESMIIVGDTLSVLPFIGFMWQCFSLCGACCTVARPVEVCGQFIMDLSEAV